MIFNGAFLRMKKVLLHNIIRERKRIGDVQMKNIKKTILVAVFAVAAVTAFASPRSSLGAKPAELKYQSYMVSGTEQDTIYVGNSNWDVETWRCVNEDTLSALFKQLDNCNDLGAYPEKKTNFKQLDKFFKSPISEDDYGELTWTDFFEAMQTAGAPIYFVNITTTRYEITVNVVEYDNGKMQGYKYTYESKSVALSNVIRAFNDAAQSTIMTMSW